MNRLYEDNNFKIISKGYPARAASPTPAYEVNEDILGDVINIDQRTIGDVVIPLERLESAADGDLRGQCDNESVEVGSRPA